MKGACFGISLSSYAGPRAARGAEGRIILSFAVINSSSSTSSAQELTTDCFFGA
jgi:hypothetical protein